MKLKSAIMALGLPLTALTASLSVSADEPETTSNIPTGTTVVTQPVQTQAPQGNDSQAAESTTRHIPTAGSIVIDKDKIETGDFFNEIMEYVGDDNAANLNDNLKNNALAINSTTIDYNDKSMFTITTRSGDVFYLIINNSDGTCLFLNAVDTADLTSLLNKGSTAKNSQNEQAVKEIEQEQKEQQTASTAKSSDQKADTTAASSKKGVDWSSNIILIACALIGCVFIAIAGYIFKSKRKKSSSSSYDSDFDTTSDEPQAGFADDEDILEMDDD